jgi:hypothetical protein
LLGLLRPSITIYRGHIIQNVFFIIKKITWKELGKRMVKHTNLALVLALDPLVQVGTLGRHGAPLHSFSAYWEGRTYPLL